MRKPSFKQPPDFGSLRGTLNDRVEADFRAISFQRAGLQTSEVLLKGVENANDRLGIAWSDFPNQQIHCAGFFSYQYSTDVL
jgi:hypothetical protein